MRFTFALSLLSGAAALPEPIATTLHKVSLSQGRSLTHANGRANIPEIFASLDATLAKFGGKPLPHHEPMAPQSATHSAERQKEEAKKRAKVHLNAQVNSKETTNSTSISYERSYHGPVTIGSGEGNAQTFEL